MDGGAKHDDRSNHAALRSEAHQVNTLTMSVGEGLLLVSIPVSGAGGRRLLGGNAGWMRAQVAQSIIEAKGH